MMKQSHSKFLDMFMPNNLTSLQHCDTQYYPPMCWRYADRQRPSEAMHNSVHIV